MGTIISSASSPIKTFYKVNNFTAITGVGTNEITGTVEIPANTIDKYGVAEITARIVKTGTNGTVTTRIYANTTASLSGAVLLGATAPAGATNLFVQITRTLMVDASTKVFSTGAAIYDDIGVSTGAETLASIDWTQNQFIILAVVNASTLDSTAGSGIIFKAYK